MYVMCVVHTCVLQYTHVHKYVMYVCACMYVCICIYMYIYIYLTYINFFIIIIHVLYANT